MYRVFLALRYLRSRLVNLISVGGVMAGVAVLIVVTSVMDGFRVRVLEVVRGNLSDLTLTPTGPEVPPYAEMDTLLRRLEPEVVATAPQVSLPVFYLYESWRRFQVLPDGHAVLPMTAVGIDWDRERRVSDLASYLVAANDREQPFASPRAVDREKAGTLLASRTFAERFLGLGTFVQNPEELLEHDVGITFLTMGEEPPGGAQATNGPTYRVRPDTYQLVTSGVYDALDTSLDATQIYMDRETLRRIAGIPDEYHQIRVRLRHGEAAPQVKASLLEKLPGFQAETWQDQRAQFLRAVNNEKVMLVVVLSFIVLLGGFIILATLTLTVVEKTRDIGVLSALGATGPGVLRLFVGIALLIGVVGAGLGVGLGWLFTSNVNAIKDFLAERLGIQVFPADVYLFREIPTVWDWGNVLSIVVGSIAVALLAGLIPALRAARMDPVRALRYE